MHSVGFFCVVVFGFLSDGPSFVCFHASLGCPQHRDDGAPSSLEKGLQHCRHLKYAYSSPRITPAVALSVCGLLCHCLPAHCAIPCTCTEYACVRPYHNERCVNDRRDVHERCVKKSSGVLLARMRKRSRGGKGGPFLGPSPCAKSAICQPAVYTSWKEWRLDRHRS